MLTAAVRDLHLCYPGQYVTDVRTPSPALWENNPWITSLDDEDPTVQFIDAEYPLINQSNRLPYHFIHGYIHDLNTKLGLKIMPTAFKGDIHLSRFERSSFSIVRSLATKEIPYWVVVAGGKFDYTTKWWSAERFQKVVSALTGKVQFVQVGNLTDHHPKLEGAIDLRGQTDLRQLIRLIYHSQGVLCPVTAVMHLSAAIEFKRRPGTPRPCVVIAGGREPVHWEAYPGHQFLHTVGALKCSSAGGCWRSRVTPLNDGTESDKSLCENVVDNLPKCMDLIGVEAVLQAIKVYFEGNALRYLTRTEANAGSQAVERTRYWAIEEPPLTLLTARPRMEQFIATIPPYPTLFRGAGIVICAGGTSYFTCAWVCVNMLRIVGCQLPIEVWYLDASEFDQEMADLLKPLNVECVNAHEVRKTLPVRSLNGWSLKPYAILHSRFEEVLFLDADNLPVSNPEYLLSSNEYRKTGVILWPDLDFVQELNPVWQICGVEFEKMKETESGQLLFHKKKCWEALSLAVWINSHSDFFYTLIYGDKETYALALKKLGQEFSRPKRGIEHLEGTFCQHDFAGQRIFQHRNRAKWSLQFNRRIPGFIHERKCFALLRELRMKWDCRASKFVVPPPRRHRKAAASSPTIYCCMTSCPSRQNVLKKTLASWAKSDWADIPISVSLFEDLSLEAKMRGIVNCQRTLKRALRESADYILFLEDDLKFNRYIGHNILNWQPFREGQVELATLYNPGIEATAVNLGANYLIGKEASVYGSQALILSRSMVKLALQEWDPSIYGQDTIIVTAAEKVGHPIFIHSPSLVQHVGSRSTWGGISHQAADFKPLWKAPAFENQSIECHAH